MTQKDLRSLLDFRLLIRSLRPQKGLKTVTFSIHIENTETIVVCLHSSQDLSLSKKSELGEVEVMRTQSGKRLTLMELVGGLVTLMEWVVSRSSLMHHPLFWA